MYIFYNYTDQMINCKFGINFDIVKLINPDLIIFRISSESGRTILN
jgi:hypothetical protein